MMLKQHDEQQIIVRYKDKLLFCGGRAGHDETPFNVPATCHGGVKKRLHQTASG
jgi:hypothetical protein